MRTKSNMKGHVQQNGARASEELYTRTCRSGAAAGQSRRTDQPTPPAADRSLAPLPAAAVATL